MITPAKYAEICLYYFNYYVSTGSRDRQLILVQSGVLKTALENDCKFFFPGDYQTIKRERFAEMDQKPVAVYEIVKDYLDWQSGNTIHGTAWSRLHVRPNDLQNRLMNPENELLLSVIHRAIAQQIPLAPRTPWLVVILQKGSSGKPIYDEWKELVESQVSDKTLQQSKWKGILDRPDNRE